MKVFVTGGTGFIGSRISARLAARGDEVTVLTRSSRARESHPGVAFLRGDPRVPGPWQSAAGAHDAVINLSGASIFGLWTKRRKREILDSRVESTSLCAAALKATGAGPKTLLSGSAVGYYGFHGDEELDESAPPGGDFLAGVASAWERAALAASGPAVRVVTMRFGLVLGDHPSDRGGPQRARGGVLDKMIPLFRWGLGGPIGGGRQWFSWIHIRDLVEGLLFLLDHPEISGPVNLCAPLPVRNGELARALGRSLRRPSFIRAPAPLVRLVLGEFGNVVLRGQRVVPERLRAAGFAFRFPSLEEALTELLGPPR